MQNVRHPGGWEMPFSGYDIAIEIINKSGVMETELACQQAVTAMGETVGPFPCLLNCWLQVDSRREELGINSWSFCLS